MNHWLIETVLVVLSLIQLMGFAGVVMHCLWYRREATSTLAWIFTAWSIPLLGPFLFLAFGMNRVAAKAWRRQALHEAFRVEREARRETVQPINYWRSLAQESHPADLDPMARDLNSVMDGIQGDCPLLAGNAVQILLGGDEAFPRMLAAIAAARHHIHLQTFILGNDAVAAAFLDALERKAREGVTVRLQYDRFGSTFALVSGMLRRRRSIPNLQISGWTQANMFKRRFQLNLRNHRKLLVVDGEEAFMGGLNLHAGHTTDAKGAAIRDYHFHLRGPIVHELQYTFLSDWYAMTEEDAGRLLCAAHFPDLGRPGEARIRVVNGGATVDREVMADAYCAAIHASRKRILAVTPYLVPSPDILRAFRLAALRGVEVRIVVPAVNNHRTAGLAGQALFAELLRSGVRIYRRRPPFIHAKALVIDDHVSIVGTANLDMRSLRLNFETNVAIFDERFCDALRQVIHEDIAMSDEVEMAAWARRSPVVRVAENLCSLLTPIL